jgi:ribosomal protein S18 acetylase RimI-like enzyme
MEKLNKEVIQTVAQVMADSFLADPMNAAQLEGIRDKDKVLQSHALLHAQHAAKTNSLTILDGDPRAFLIGFDSEKQNRFREWILHATILLKSFTSFGIKDLMLMWTNMKRHGKALSFNWHKEFVNGRHYRVKIIAIDKSLRGTGAFRKLIAPYMGFSDKEKIPMVLETHNPANVGLYQHFGFELVKTITSPDTPVEQYCMIRKPVENPYFYYIEKLRKEDRVVKGTNVVFGYSRRKSFQLARKVLF